MRALLSVFLVCLCLAASLEDDGSELELVYVANEGFLLRAGEQAVLIDAFVTEPYSIYAAVPEAMFADMLGGKEPFEAIDVALTSHVHRDHFQPRAAAAFLRARPETDFLSSPQVLDELVEVLGDHPAAERAEAFLPESGRTVVAREGVHVELLRLAHSGGRRTAGVQNLGHLVELGGASVLHVGDADAKGLGVYELAKRGVDVALVPYWWFGDADSVREARKVTGARVLVAVHIPPAQVDEVATLLESLDPAILVFRKAGEARKIEFTSK
jgi:L-ascorbate metabolism protein UlaG (beta-lactamase superfamily)